MINDILDLSQITNGKLKLNPTYFNVTEAIRDVSKLIKFQAKRKGIKFIIENTFEKPKSVKIRSDANRLKQVILNLLGNALKFTEKGFIKIKFEPEACISTSQISQFQSIKFSVQDTGCGIKDDDIPKLFQVYGKLENSDSQKLNKAGIGLGLAISQNLVKCMNNNLPEKEIKVTSVWGEGTTFYFSLHPIHDCDDEGDMETNIEGLPQMECKQLYQLNFPNNTYKRVLLVDDDQINIIVLTKYFESFKDCKYDLAFNGAQAVELIKAKAKENTWYDLVFMDCNMPVMNGFEATRKILDLIDSGEIPYVPVVASTANTSPLDYENCLKSGMIDYVSKPFLRSQLRAKLNLCFTGKYKKG